MGTNYYLIENVCEHCGRGDDRLHIGKSSAGWCFGLHVIPEEGINDLADWEARWSRPGTRIEDEYGDVVAPAEMRLRITDRRAWERADGQPLKPLPPHWYRDNHAEPGPDGLVRHAIYPGHCIGHGEGTWDLMMGEFS